MENLTENGKPSAEEAIGQAKETGREGLFLSPKEALEYCNFKREKFRAEAARAMSATTVDLRFAGGAEEEKRLLSIAFRHLSASVTLTGSRLPHILPLLSATTAADVWIGGDGKTHFKVKLFELKTAIKMGAREATVAPDPWLIGEEKFSEIKKRLKQLKRKAKKTPVKISLSTADGTAIVKLYRIAAECGVGVSVPYFKGVERLKTEGVKGAFLQVTDVATVADFKRLKAAGVDRIGAVDSEEIYLALMKEAEDCALSVPMDRTAQGGESGAGGASDPAAVYRAVLEDEIK